MGLLEALSSLGVSFACFVAGIFFALVIRTKDIATNYQLAIAIGLVLAVIVIGIIVGLEGIRYFYPAFLKRFFGRIALACYELPNTLTSMAKRLGMF
ncbi:MAG: hypothetical protein WCW77_02730 [Patescibacteria group bacterium]